MFKCYVLEFLRNAPAGRMLAVVLLSCLASQVSHAAQPASAGKTQPNVLLIMVDDLGARDLAVTGSRYYETPSLDRFAAGAVRFSHAYSSAPVCSPTRAALLTGKHPARLGITHWIPGDFPEDRPLRTPAIPEALPLSEVTIAERLRSAGYATFFAGKWHLGGPGHLPQDQGFEVNVGGNHSGQPRSYYSPYSNPQLPDGPPGEYLEDRLTDETLRFIESARGRPFFAMLSFYAVHTPIHAAPRHVEHFRSKAAARRPAGGLGFEKEGGAYTKLIQDNAQYASMVRAVDDDVGRLMRALDRLGLADDTIVIVTSDNGGLATIEPDPAGNPRPGTPTANVPLRAGKGWLYEGGLRIPLMIRAPGARRGIVSSVPVDTLDIVPTLLEAARIVPPPADVLDGVSLQPLLSGRTLPAGRKLYWHFPHYHASGSVPSGAVLDGDWKLIEFFETQTVELYDLARDPSERRNLAARDAQRAAALRLQMRQWRSDVGARMPTVNAQYAPSSAE